MIKRIILTIVLFLAAQAALGQESLTMAVGGDVIKDVGRPYVELRYYGQEWKHWSFYIVTDETIGIELYYPIGRWQLGLGPEYSRATNIVSTNWGYQVRAEYWFKKDWALGIKHRSNCQVLCDNDVLKAFRIGKDDDRNQGYNYFYVRKRF